MTSIRDCHLLFLLPNSRREFIDLGRQKKKKEFFQVRVCDGCYEKTTAKKTDASCSPSSIPLSSKADKSMSVDARKTAEQRARELKQAEEDEINLAIALSQSEAEAQVYFWCLRIILRLHT